MLERQDKTPLSEYADAQHSNFKWALIFWIAIGSVMSMLYGTVNEDSSGELPLSGMAKIILTFVSLPFLITALTWKKRKLQDLKTRLHNQLDYDRMQRMLQLFSSLDHVDTSDFNSPPQEAIPVRNLRPHRVEYVLSSFVRSVAVTRLSGIFGRKVSTEVSSASIPNFLDQSALVFLSNEDGEVLQVIVPSPECTVEAMKQIVKARMEQEKGKTHVREYLGRSAEIDPSIFRSIGNIKVLNELDAQIQRSIPFGERPVVKVYGSMVQNGVAVASALGVNDQMYHFFPASFIKAFADDLDAIGSDTQLPELTGLVGQSLAIVSKN